MAGMCASGFGVIAAAIDIVKQLNQRISFSIYILARIALIAVLSYLTIFFFHRWREAGKELKKSRLVEPTTPPDFSELSDGSRQIDHLENLK